MIVLVLVVVLLTMIMEETIAKSDDGIHDDVNDNAINAVLYPCINIYIYIYIYIDIYIERERDRYMCVCT